jgi:hypothetical protein
MTEAYRDVAPFFVSDDMSVLVTCHGVALKVVHMLDEEGTFCDKDEAVVLVAGSDEFGWVEVDLRDCDAREGALH